MSEHFQSSLAFVLAQEGGFAKLKNDETTNLGVKQSTWEDWIKKKVTEADMRKLTIADVTPLYRKNYYERAHCDRLFYPLSLCAFDLAVHSGAGRCLAMLSYLSGVSLDTKMRDKLVEYLNNLEHKREFVLQFINARRNFLRTLRNYNLYGKGWEARVRRLEAQCLAAFDHPDQNPAT